MTGYFVYMNDRVISWHDLPSDAWNAVFDYRHVLDIAGVDSRIYDFTISDITEEDAE